MILCQRFHPQQYSTAQILTELAEKLTARGMEVSVVAGAPSSHDRKEKFPKSMEFNGIAIRRVAGTSFSKHNIFGRFINDMTYLAATFLHLLFKKLDAPILVITNPPWLGLIAALFKSIKGTPFIYLVFDVYPETAVRLGVLKKKGLPAKTWNAVNKFIFKRAEEVVVLGRCMQEVIERTARNMNRPMENKIHRIHIWAEEDKLTKIPKTRNPFIKKWDLEGKFVVLYSGNMGRFHDLETIMEAARLLDREQEIVFLFIGDGYKKAWAQKTAQQWNLSNCRFFPFVKREELPYSFSCADVGLVSLSAGQEGLSVPSKSYGMMAAGIPVIAIMPPACEVARVIEEEQSGFVVQPGDGETVARHIRELRQHPAKLKHMGLNAKTAIKTKYSLEKAVDSYDRLIRDAATPKTL